MGNLSSCLKPKNSSNYSKNKAKLVDLQGQVKLVELPITVAELMLENPGFALTSVDELRLTNRLPAMKADDRLLGQKIYAFVPVDKVNSRLTDLQLASFERLIYAHCDQTVGRRTRGGSKVSPILGSTGLAGESLEELVKDFGGKSSITGVTGQRKRLCKGWEPVLESILEGC